MRKDARDAANEKPRESAEPSGMGGMSRTGMGATREERKAEGGIKFGGGGRGSMFTNSRRNAEREGGEGGNTNPTALGGFRSNAARNTEQKPSEKPENESRGTRGG